MVNFKNTSCFTIRFASFARFVVFSTLPKITIYMQCKLEKAEAPLSRAVQKRLFSSVFANFQTAAFRSHRGTRAKQISTRRKCDDAFPFTK